MTRSNSVRRFAALSVVFAFAFAACGGDDDGTTTVAPSPDDAPASDADADADNDADADADQDPPDTDGDVVDPVDDDAVVGVRAGGDLRFGLGGAWDLDPAGTIGTAQSMQVALAIYDHLARPTAEGDLEPELLTSWESEDSVTWTLTLRDGVRFHDGTSFDADALVANFDRLADPETGCPCAPQLARIDTVEALDPSTVRIELLEPWAAFPVVVLGAPFSLVPSPAAVAEAGDDYGTLVAVGTGPYRLVESVPGELVRVERNEDYWGDAPDFDTVSFRPIPDEQTRLQSVLAGDIDLMTALNPDTAEQARNAGVQADTLIGLGPLMVQMNFSVPPLDDPAVRLALAAGVDRDALNRVAYGGGSSPASGMMAPESPFTAGVAGPETDIELARSLMQEIGPVSLTLSHPPEPSTQNVAQVLQQMWGDVGFQIELRPVEQAQYVPAVFGGDFELALWTGPEIRDPDELTAHVSTGGGINVAGYSNPRADELLDAGRREADPAARVGIYQELAAILAEDVPHVYTLRKVGAIVWSDAVASIPEPETWGVQIIDVRRIRSAG